MQISINLPHVFNPQATKLDNSYVLRALLDCMVNINLAYIQTHRPPGLLQSGVRYGRTKLWEPIPALYMPNKHTSLSIYYEPLGESGGKKRGDCKSLATALIAEYLAQGIAARPVFRFADRPDSSGALDFHILCMVDKSVVPSGWRDPSRELGMGDIEVARFGPIIDLLR